MSSSTSSTITTYFQKILFRDPTTSELSSWTTLVDNSTLSLDQVRANIVNSSAATDFVDPVIRLYQAAFGRVPDSNDALNTHVDRLTARTATVVDLASNFAASPEFIGRYGNTGPSAAYITALYVNVLGRTPAAKEVDWYLNSGMTTAQMLLGFSQSPEFQERTDSAVDAFLNSNALGTAVFTGPLQIVQPGQTFTLTTSAPTITEGDAGTKALTFTVSLDRAPTEAVTVNYQTLTSGTATAGDDFVAAAGTVTFAAGQRTASVSVNVLGDTAFEANETVRVQFTGSTLAAAVTATGTITNDDTDPTTAPQTFSLTAGVDAGAAFTGAGGDDTFNAYLALDPTSGEATVETLSAFDVLDGGAGTDTLNVRAVGAWTAPASASVQNIEAADVRGDDSITINTATWAGLTSLNVVSVAGATVTAGATTDVTIANSDNNAVEMTGGKAVTVNTDGNVLLQGSVTTANVTTGVGQSQQVTIGGASSSIPTTGIVSAAITGGVTVLVSDHDANGDSSGTLTTVSISGADSSGSVTIEGDALTNLSLTDTAAGATVTAVAGTRTLNLSLNEVTGGTITDATATTLAVTATGKASSGFTLDAAAATSVSIAADAELTGDLMAAAAKTVTISGDKAVIITALANNLAAEAVITSTNTAGVTLSAQLGDDVTFTGADGDDEVTVGATTKAISMGGGDDTVNMTAVLGTDGALDGGAGTDTLAMDAATATLLTTEQAVTNFEKVSLGRVAQGDNDTLDLANLPGVNHVISAGVAGSGQQQGTVQILDFTGAYAEIQSNIANYSNPFYYFDANPVNNTNAIWLANATSDADVAFSVLNALMSLQSVTIGITTYAIGPVGYFGSSTTKIKVEFPSLSVPDLFVSGDGNNSAANSVLNTVGPLTTSLLVDNLASGGTFELTDTLDGEATVNVTDAATGTADVLNVVLNGASNIANTGSLIVADVETINITATDSDTANNPAAASDLKLDAGAATTITVTGNHGVNFINSSTLLTNVVTLDASTVVGTGTTAAAAATAGAVTFSSAVTNKNVTVTTANGDDSIDVSSITDATKSATVSTGTGNDTVTGSAGADNITVGDGDDSVTAGGGADTVSLGSGNDVVVGGDGADLLTGGTGRDRFAYNASSESLATATGFDKIADFGLVTTAVVAADVNSMTASTFATDKGGANADLLDFGVTIQAASAITQFSTQQMTLIGAATGSDVLVTDDIKYSINTKGLIALSGSDAAKVDTIAEWVVIANDLTTGNPGTAAAFELSGNTYVFVQDATDALIELTGVNLGAANGLVLIGQQNGTMAAAVGDLLIN